MSFQIGEKVNKDPIIKDLSQESIPKHLPAGFRILYPGESNRDIGQAAYQILNTSSLGDQTKFTVDGQLYLGRTEPHYHPPPPANTPISEYNRYPKPWGWHKGVTVFKAITNQPSENYQPARPTSGRMSFLQRIDQFFSKLDKV